MIIKLTLIYWVAINILTLIAAGLGWWDLRVSKKKVARYQGRILLTEALRSITTIVGINLVKQALLVHPVYMSVSVVVATLLSGALWGWFLYARGILKQ